MSLIMSILSTDGYIILNKQLIKMLGLNATILLGELCSEYIYWEKQNKLEDNYFFSTRENIKDETTLSSYQQRQAIKILEDLKIIHTIEKNMPKKHTIKYKKIG